MKEQSFEGATEAEANQRAEEWIKSQSGITVTTRRVIAMSSGSSQPRRKIVPDSWTVIVEYDDPN
jgi:hypothetical protein